MNSSGKTLLILLYLIYPFFSSAQLKQVYHFQKDDSLLKRNYYMQAQQTQNRLISSVSKEYKKDYTEIYESRFKEVARLLQSSSTVTSPEAHQYLQSLLKKIIDVNEELKPLNIRLVFTRDTWPNAYSMGDGTIAVNAGLLIFLENEAELIFVICHELSHYYLDHSNQTIKRNVELVNSEAFKKEIKRLSKEQYKVGRQLDTLYKDLIFNSRHHSRTNETEADRQAFIFMKNTGYSYNGITTCLQKLNNIDDSLLSKPLHLENIFQFSNYPFKKKWIQKESAIFGQMGTDDSTLSQKEKDSLKTHPDCDKRILLLKDSIQQKMEGSSFIVNEDLFNRLKKDFYIEMIEQQYRDKHLTRNLYYNLLLIQEGEQLPFAVYSVARALNLAWQSQKDHEIGKFIEQEGREYPADYNLLLRMFDRIKLDEIAMLNLAFCTYYQEQMKGYEGFEEEMKKAKQHIN